RGTVTMMAPGGGTNRYIWGEMGSKLTEVKPTTRAALRAPRANTATRSGIRSAASTLTSIRPTSVAEVRGSRTSVYTLRPATRAVSPTDTTVVGVMAARLFRASSRGSTRLAGFSVMGSPDVPAGSGSRWYPVNVDESHAQASVLLTMMERSEKGSSSLVRAPPSDRH